MSESKKTNTEQLILEAAEQEFLVKGYDGARTTTIAEKAGVTHAMLHYYFRTKEQLFERIVAKNSVIVIQTIIAAMTGDPRMPVKERILSGMSSHFDLIVSNPQLPRFFLNEIILRPERYHMLYEAWQEKLGTLFSNLQAEVDQAAARGEMDSVDVRMLFISIVSLNVFPFIAQSFADPLMGNMSMDRETFLARRKAENIEIIMRRIKKQ